MALAIVTGASVIALMFAAAAYLDMRRLTRRVDQLGPYYSTPLEDLLTTYKHVAPEWFTEDPPSIPNQRGPS